MTTNVDKRGYFEHYPGGISKPITARKVVDRIASRAVRQPSSDGGVKIGTWVSFNSARDMTYGYFGGTHKGQVWDQAPAPGYWWVAIAGTDRIVMVHHVSMDVLGQATEDVALFGEDAVA